MTDHATRAREIAERLANWVVTKRPVYFECETVFKKELAAALDQAAQPVWSTEKPTYDGPWQWRSSKECGRAVIYIRVLPDPMTGVPRIWQDVPNNGTWIDYGEWAPCPLPREEHESSL